MKFLAISEHLKLFMTDGKPLVQSSYGYNPLQIEGQICKWQEENPDHPRFPDSVMWLDAYQSQIAAYNMEIQVPNILLKLQVVKKHTAKQIMQIKQGVPCREKENAERGMAALFFWQVREDLKALGFSDQQAHARAIPELTDLFHNLGYSHEQTDQKVIEAVERAQAAFGV